MAEETNTVPAPFCCVGPGAISEPRRRLTKLGGGTASGDDEFTSDRCKALQGQSGWVSFIHCLSSSFSKLHAERRPQRPSFRHCSVRVLGREAVRAITLLFSTPSNHRLYGNSLEA